MNTKKTIINRAIWREEIMQEIKRNFFLAVIGILRVTGKDAVSVEQALGSVR